MFSARKHMGWALASVVIQAVTIITLKYAALQCGQFFCWSVIALYGMALVFIGLRVVTWNLALAKGCLSEVYTLTALTPVFLLILAALVLQEQISTMSMAGAIIIVFGIYLQQRGKGDQRVSE